MSRYRLPFITTTHHTRSPWLGKSQDNQSQLSLHSGLPAEALRIAWNVAWHDGIAEALAGKNCSSERYESADCVLYQLMFYSLNRVPAYKQLLCVIVMHFYRYDCKVRIYRNVKDPM